VRILRQVLIGPENSARLLVLANRLAPRLDYRLVADLCRAEIQQWRASPAGFGGPRLTRLGRSFFGNLSHALRLVRLLDPGSIVYSTGETWGLPLALAAAPMRNRRFAHVVYVHRVFSPAWLRFLGVTHQLLAVDGWICVTRCQADLLHAALGRGAAPVEVVSQGVDTRFFDPAKGTASEGRPFVLSVGAEMRNYDLLFDAVRGLDVGVLVKASSSWMADGRSQLAAIPANVKVITQHLTYVELRDLYAGAALVVVPLEDTPQAAGITTILEGMAMGKCILATRSRGLPDGLTSGENCVIVEPEPGQLAHAITDLLSHPERMDALAANGRCFVLRNYTLEHHAERVSAFLRAVADSQ